MGEKNRFNPPPQKKNQLKLVTEKVSFQRVMHILEFFLGAGMERGG